MIYFTDVLDEYVMQQLTEFEDHKFANVAKEDIKVCGRAAGGSFASCVKGIGVRLQHPSLHGCSCCSCCWARRACSVLHCG